MPAWQALGRQEVALKLEETEHRVEMAGRAAITVTGPAAATAATAVSPREAL
jgi:hypothetical protein